MEKTMHGFSPSLQETSSQSRRFAQRAAAIAYPPPHTSRNCNTTMRMQLQVLPLGLASSQVYNQTDTDSSTGRMPTITKSQVIDEERVGNHSGFKHQKERPATTPPRTRRRAWWKYCTCCPDGVDLRRKRETETESGVKSSPTNNNNDALATNCNNNALNAVTAESDHSWTATAASNADVVVHDGNYYYFQPYWMCVWCVMNAQRKLCHRPWYRVRRRGRS